MSGITIVAANTDLDDALKDRYHRTHLVRRVWSDVWPSPASAVVEIVAAAPEVILLGPGLDRADALDLLIEIDRTQPQVGVIALLDHPTNEQVLEFHRNGAREVLDESSSIDAIAKVIDELAALLEQRRSNVSSNAVSKRRVIAFLSPKGGTGKTTLSTNLAAGMAMRARNQVLLLDLDTQFGDAAPALGLEPEFSLANTAGLGSSDRASMKVFLTLHSSSLAVLGPPDDFASAEALDVTQLKDALTVMCDEFPYVVIDTAAGIDDFSLLALEFATDLVFVTTTDVASIRAVKRQLDALDQLGMVGHRRHFVLNRADARAGLSVSDIEGTIGMRASVEVPVSRGLPLSSNQGEPMVTGDSRDSALRSLTDLVDMFLPDPSAEPKRSFRLFGKKD